MMLLFLPRTTPRCREPTAGLRLVGVDPPVTEVADQQVATELAEPSGAQASPHGAFNE
jgi:hypothetical protein